MNDQLHWFAPITFSKGSDGKTQIMKMGGVASTTDKDEQGESLQPKGYDIKYFKENGLMNWNHQTGKDPLAYIGRPTRVEITKKGLELDCELFNTNPRAKQVYQLAEILKAQGV